MATSLYDLSVPTFLQTMSAVSGYLDRAARHCAETGTNADDFADARLYPDMAPFHFQIEALWHHAVWGVEALITGKFTPPGLIGSMPFADMQAIIARGVEQLKAFDREEVDACAGKELDMQIGPRRLHYAADRFILSFSFPNFHFHAVTAYDILRTRGVPVGKRDYEGKLQTLTPPIERSNG